MYRDLLDRVRGGGVAEVSRRELDRILAPASVLLSEETGVAGPIRILLLEGLVLVPEESPTGEIFLRRSESREARSRFVEARLATYERMGDGCGCRIDYRA